MYNRKVRSSSSKFSNGCEIDMDLSFAYSLDLCTPVSSIYQHYTRYSIFNLPKQIVSPAVDSHNIIHQHGHPIPTARKTMRIRPRPPHPSRRRATTPHQPRTNPQHQSRLGHPRPQRPRLLELRGLAETKTHHVSVARSLGFEIRSVSDGVAR